MPGRVEEAGADVTDRPQPAEGVLVGRCDGVPALLQQGGRLQAADADQRHRQVLPVGRHALHRGIGQQAPPHRRATDQPRGRDVGGAGPDQRGQLLEQPVRLRLDGRDPHAADQLDDGVRPGRAQRTQPVDDREQRLAPGRDADPLAPGQGRLQVAGPGRSQSGRDGRLVAVDVDDDRLQQPVALFQRLLEIGVHALGDDHDRADDADLPGSLQQPRDLGLGDVQDAGDLALPQSLLVVEVRDLGHQPHLAVGGDASHPSWLRHLTCPFPRESSTLSAGGRVPQRRGAERSQRTCSRQRSRRAARARSSMRGLERPPGRTRSRCAADPPAGQVGDAEGGDLGQVGHLHRAAEQIGLGLHHQRRGGHAAVGADAGQRGRPSRRR